MQKRLRWVLLFAIFGALSMAVQGQTESAPQQASGASTPTPDVELGQLDGTNYVNDFFGLSLSIPKEWVVASAQRRAEFDQQIKKWVDAPDQKKLAQVQSSIERSKTLLRITKLPEGLPNNAQFHLLAERIASPNLKTALDVIAAMKQTMNGTNFKLEFREVRTERLGTASFGVADTSITSPLGNYKQRVYITIKNGYAIELFFTYLNDADLVAFADILKSVKVK